MPLSGKLAQHSKSEEGPATGATSATPSGTQSPHLPVHGPLPIGEGRRTPAGASCCEKSNPNLISTGTPSRSTQ